VTPTEILTELEKLALRLGVPVRFETFSIPGDLRVTGKGGLCRLRGKPIIVVDAALPLLDKIGVLSEALATFDLEAIYLPPVLRARIDSNRREKGRRESKRHDGSVRESNVRELSQASASASARARRGPVAPILRGPAKAVRRVNASGGGGE
jgi:hypothetical protein